MELPHIDHLIEDLPLAKAHEHYLAWLSTHREHAFEVNFLQSFQRGSGTSLRRLRAQLAQTSQELLGHPIDLPDVRVFVGETSHGFAVINMDDGIAIVIDFRKLMLIALYEFFLGTAAGHARSHQLATWLLCAVICAREAEFEAQIPLLACEAMVIDQGVFFDLIGSIADLIILHEIGHAVSDQMAAEFARVRYLPLSHPHFGGEHGENLVSVDPHTQPLCIVLPERQKHWQPEFVADCFSIFADYAVVLQAYQQDRHKAVDALSDALLNWNLTYFSLGSMQDWQATLVGQTDAVASSHPDGRLRAFVVDFFLRCLMHHVLPGHDSPAMARAMGVAQRLWSDEFQAHVRQVHTYFVYVPEAFKNFVDRTLQPVLSGCLYDELNGTRHVRRLQANLDENADQWDRFHTTSYFNGEPVIITMAEWLAALGINFVSEER
jgi:hypothetical protein